MFIFILLIVCWCRKCLTKNQKTVTCKYFITLHWPNVRKWVLKCPWKIRKSIREIWCVFKKPPPPTWNFAFFSVIRLVPKYTQNDTPIHLALRQVGIDVVSESDSTLCISNWHCVNLVNKCRVVDKWRLFFDGVERSTPSALSLASLTTPMPQADVSPRQHADT